MYLQHVLRVVLVCFLATKFRTVQAERIESIAPYDDEAKLRSVQVEKIGSLTPNGEDLASLSTDRRRWGLWKKA